MKLTRSHQCVHATIAISCGSPYRSSITTRGTEKTGTSVLARYASSFRPLNLFLYRYLFLYISVFIFIYLFIYFDLVNFYLFSFHLLVLNLSVIIGILWMTDDTW